MTDSAICLPATLLADVFPFHLAVNQEKKLLQIGKALQRICPELSLGSLFEEHFHIQRPVNNFNFDAIKAHLQSLFILEVQHSSVLLKGQMVYLDKQNVLVFLGSPWISDLNALTPIGLALSDFAIHDPVVDYLVLLQSQKTALSDARNLAEKLKQQRADVHQALEREKELNDLKSRFITTTSHEFRTPLGIIASSAGILQDYAERINFEMRQKHLTRIQSAVNRMTGLLEDVLIMNQVETGVLKANLHPLNLGNLCQEIVKKTQGNTLHRLTYTLSPDLVGQVFLLDQNLLNQLLNNLLSNAVKYTPEPGNIVLEVGYQEEQIIFTVQDSGIGIPSAELSSIFDPFNRASNAGNVAGTGLGLAIVKHCVEIHSGTIKIVSEVGVGTTITVTIPLQRVSAPSDLNEDLAVC